MAASFDLRVPTDFNFSVQLLALDAVNLLF